MKKICFSLFVATAMLCAIPTLYASDKPLEITILHINDHHSHLDAEPLELIVKDKKYEMEAGGIARVAGEIKALKQTSKNPLVLHAGDATSGTLYFTLFKGQADVEMMNEIGFDAFTLGNHEFDEGDAVLARFIEKANFPVITSNVEAKKGSLLSGKWQPYIIKEIGGELVGIIGLETAQKTSASSRPGNDISFYDEIVRTQKYVDILTAKGINKIILLSHFGYENDQRLAQKVEGVDVIIDGDSHSLLGDFSSVGLASAGPYPTKVLSKDGHTVCIAQAWEYAKVLGELHVAFDGNGTLSSCSGIAHLLVSDKAFAKEKNGNKREIGSDEIQKITGKLNESSAVSVVAPDPVITKKLSLYSDQIQSKASEVVGMIGEDLRHIRVPGKTYDGIDGKELPYGSELAPVVAASFYNASLRADACIQNAGGVRSGLKKGSLSIGGAYNLLPFSNTLVEIELSGAEIKQVLEDALINFYDNYGSDGSFPYAYALRYDIDMSRPKNDRVYGLEIKSRSTGKWAPLDMTKQYVIVVNSYIAEGRDGYTTLAQVQRDRGKGVDTYLDYAMSFVQYVQSAKSQGDEVMRLPSDERCIKSYQ